MNRQPAEPAILRRRLTTLEETRALAADVARFCRRGDVIALRGDLGAGKTAWARAFVESRAAAEGVDAGDVPSPTFTLVQGYELPACPIFHFDLYRLERAEEAVELGFDDAVREGITLIEWPDRLGEYLPRERLDLTLRFGRAPGERDAELRGSASWAERMKALARND